MLKRSMLISIFQGLRLSNRTWSAMGIRGHLIDRLESGHGVRPTDVRFGGTVLGSMDSMDQTPQLAVIKSTSAGWAVFASLLSNRARALETAYRPSQR